MKLTTAVSLSLLLSLLSVGQLKAADNAKLSNNLKMFERFIGEWEFTFTNENGEQSKGRYVFEVGAMGEDGAVSVTSRMLGGAKNPPIQTAIWYFNPEIKKIVGMEVMSDGAVSTTIFQKRGSMENAAADLSSIILPDGRRASCIAHTKWIDKDTFEYWQTDFFIEGKKQSDMHKMPFKRIKQQ